MAKIIVETKVQIEPIEVFVRNHEFTTHNCAVDRWWGEERCSIVNFNDELADIAKELPNGKFKIEIIVTQLSDND